MSQCSLVSAIPGCLYDSSTGVQTAIEIHNIYGPAADGRTILARVVYTSADGTVLPALTATQTVTPGACVPVSSDTEYTLLCDDDGDAATPNTPFVRKVVRLSSGISGALISETITDLELDLTTAYTVTGTASTCGVSDTETNDLVLCDATGASFIRRVSYINGVQVTVGDFELDGVTAFTPSGTVGACPTCAPLTPVAGVSTAW